MLIIDNLVFWGGGGAKNFQYSTKSHWAPKPLRPFPTLHGKTPVTPRISLRAGDSLRPASVLQMLTCAIPPPSS